MTVRTARRRVLRLSVKDGTSPGAGPDDGVAVTGQPRAQPESAATAVVPRADLLAAEEPLGIRLNGEALTLTMRTPGDDIDLAAGFLVGEGVISSGADIDQIKICTGEQCGHGEHQGLGNIAEVTLRPGLAAPARLHRNFLTTSACGVCGKASIHDICALPATDLAADRVAVEPAVLAQLPGRLRDAQQVFSATGGLHAAGVFTAGGTMLAVREDVGRHNAVDKVVGWALRAGRLPLAGCTLLVSGRASFELVQKAVMAGIPVLAAVSAPSSLAVELAEEAGLTLVGFLRGSSMNVYTGGQRIAGAMAASDDTG
jgi:FdhD protein